MVRLNVNGKPRELDVPGDMPLLWTLRDVLNMTGTKFGCGMGLCGACTIHIDGQPTRSCITPVSAAVGKRITTIEAIGATPAGKTDSGGLACAGRAAVRLLPVGPDHVGKRAACREAETERRRHRRRHGRQHLPLRNLSAHSRRHQEGRRRSRCGGVRWILEISLRPARRNFLTAVDGAIGGGLLLGFGRARAR